MIESIFFLILSFYFLILFRLEKLPLQKIIWLGASLSFLLLSVISFTSLYEVIQNYNYETIASNTVIKNITTTYIYSNDNMVINQAKIIAMIIAIYIISVIYEVIRNMKRVI